MFTETSPMSVHTFPRYLIMYIPIPLSFAYLQAPISAQADIGLRFSSSMPRPCLKTVRRRLTLLPRCLPTIMSIRIRSDKSREYILVHQAGCTVLRWNMAGDLSPQTGLQELPQVITSMMP